MKYKVMFFLLCVVRKPYITALLSYKGLKIPNYGGFG